MRAGRPSRTAQYVALVRAVLTDSGDLDDPYAGSMLTPSMALGRLAFGRWPLARRTRSGFWAALATRTRYFDEQVTTALDDGITQVVVVAAGFDARAWRFARDGAAFFEVDHPATQARKRRRAPAGGPTYVGVDMAADDPAPALASAGFDWSSPALFTVEGVTMYLEEDEVRRFLARLAGRAAPGSRLAVNFSAPQGTGGDEDRRRQRVLGLVGRLDGESFRSGRDVADPAALVASSGWQVDHSSTLRQQATRLLGATSLQVDAINPHASVIAASIPTRDQARRASSTS